jgi:arylsulfatase A-like enzyme
MWCGVMIALLGGLGRTAMGAETGHPNVVFILADDLGWRDLGCTGSNFYLTPNIDTLAKNGMRFTQAYAACPVCSPTRAALMTGKYPARLKLTNFIGGHKTGKLLPADYLDHLPLEEVTIAEAFKGSGYVTASIGKWHLGGKGFLPEDQGFDVSIGAANGAGMTRDYFFPYAPKNDLKAAILPDGKPGEYLTDRLTDEAVHFIDTHADKPFFLYLPYYAVHIPLQAKQTDLARFKQRKAATTEPSGPKFLPEGNVKSRQYQDNPTYAAMIGSVDDGVGRVLAELKKLNLDQNTIVVFTSDNGGLSTAQGFPTSNAPLRGGKGWLYEGGIREPLLIQWPSVIRGGGVSDHQVITNDWYPTLLALAGLPAKPEQHVDAVSFAATLHGQTQGDRGPLFWHYPHYSDQGGGPGGAIRSGDWKLIEWYDDMRCELFNLKDDQGEKTDLAAKNPAKAEELKTALHDWRKSVDANMPKPNPNHLQQANTGLD